MIQQVAGTYSGPGNCDVQVDRTISLVGLTDHPTECVIDCQGSADSPQRALHIEPLQIAYPILTLEGVSIVNGYAPGASGRGGAVLVGDLCELTGTHMAGCNQVSVEKKSLGSMRALYR